MPVSPELKMALKPVQRMSLIGWTVMTFLILVFIFLTFASLRETNPNTSKSIYLIVPLTLISLTLALISLLLKWYVTSARRIRLRVGDASKAALDASATPSPADLLVVRLYKMCRIQRFIALTLHIAITLYGVVLSFTFHHPCFILPYAGLALILNVVWFPRYRSLAARIRARRDIDGAASDGH